MRTAPVAVIAGHRFSPRIVLLTGFLIFAGLLASAGLLARSVGGLGVTSNALDERGRARAALADAARESRYVLSAIAAGDASRRSTGAPYVASSLERLRQASRAAGDGDVSSLVASISATPFARPDDTVALLDAIAARAERLTTESTIEAERRADWDAKLLGRIAIGVEALLAIGAFVLLSLTVVVWSSYRRSIRAAIPEEVAGRTDADRVAFLSGRLHRARRIAEHGRMTLDEVNAALAASTADRRDYQRLVESQAEILREQENALLRDEMTGLWRFSHLQKEVKIVVERWRQDATPFSVVALDLNKFKAINETYGHKAGDTAIRDVGRIVHEACRSTDVGCRRGGDEFMALLPATVRDDAIRIAERLRAAINAHRVAARSTDGEVTFGISSSVGLFSVEDADPDVLSHVADDVEYADNQAITHVTRGADSAQEYAKHMRGDEVYAYSKDVEEYLSAVELPPRWDHFVRHAGRVFQGLADDARELFEHHYETLVRLTLDNDRSHTAGNTNVN